MIKTYLEEQLDLLNPQQREAVVHGKDPLLLLAGAGSGKTRVVTTRIAWLVEKEGFAPWSILAVTFTNKAANEMRERAVSMVAGASEVMIKTFHSFGAWFLRRHYNLTGLKPNFTIMDDSDSVDLLKTLYPREPRGELKSYAKAISRAKDECLSPEDDLREISQRPLFPEVYRAYEKKLRAIGNVDFGDLILLPYNLLQENETLRSEVQRRFKALLVDEYQDTNLAQFRLIRLLCGKDNWITVVGDDDQSIYRFRGARVENILNFEKEFPGTRAIRLEQNYRSTTRILNIASEVVSHNKGRLGKTLWTENETGDKAHVVFLQDHREEAEYITRILSDKKYGGSAILYRTNAQSKAFEDSFREHRIPYRLVGNLSFYEREEVKDCLSYLSFYQNPANEVAFRRIINKPTRGVGAVTLDKIMAETQADNPQLLEALDDALETIKGKAKKGLQNFLDSYRKPFFDDKPEETLAWYIREFLERFDLISHYRERDRLEHTGREANISELINSAISYPPTPEGLQEFLDSLELNSSHLEEENSDQQVTLITMHNTKGLEFPRVFITGMEDGLFPSRYDSSLDESQLEEERRLFYVAITRAQKELYLSSCRYRLRFGRVEESYPSRFLQELPPEEIEEENPFTLSIEAGTTGEYSKGTRVYHDDYGNGTVFQVMQNNGHQVIHVLFESGKKATIMPEFCQHKLEKLGSGEWD